MYYEVFKLLVWLEAESEVSEKKPGLSKIHFVGFAVVRADLETKRFVNESASGF